MDSKIIRDYRGVPVLSAYAPFKALGLNWSILAEIDEAEAFAAITALRKWMIIIGLSSAGFVAGLGVLVVRITNAISNLFRNLLTELTGGATHVASASEQISASSQSLSQGGNRAGGIHRRDLCHNGRNIVRGKAKRRQCRRGLKTIQGM